MRSSKVIYSTVCSVAMLLTADAANLIVNASFEEDMATSPSNFIRSSILPTAWTQFGDGVDIYNDDYTQGPPVLVNPSDGFQFIDLNQGTAGGLGGLYQDVVVTSGFTYRLSLDASKWATNTGGTVRYSIINPFDNAILASEDYATTTVWVSRTLEATAVSNSLRVQIQAVFAPEGAPGVDNINLELIPEPSSALLIGVGVLGVVLRHRRYK